MTGQASDLLILKNGLVCVCPFAECSKTQWINTSIGLRGSKLLKDKNASLCSFSRIQGQNGDSLVLRNGALCSCNQTICLGNWTDDELTLIGPQGTRGIQGLTGAIGPAGERGATGFNGINGTNGSVGPQGPIG